MSCAPYDLRDYFFGELTVAEAKQVDSHLTSCTGCRAELSRMDVTRTAMMALPMEEPPRRIAFVSDKVFEPTLWQRFWNSGLVVGFTSACVVAAGLFFNGMMRQVPVSPAPGVDYAAMEARVRAEVSKEIPLEVAKAVALVEERNSQRLTLAVANAARKYEQKYELDVAAMQASLELRQSQLTKRYLASFDGGSR